MTPQEEMTLCLVKQVESGGEDDVLDKDFLVRSEKSVSRRKHYSA